MDLLEQINDANSVTMQGSVVETAGLMATVADFPAPVGALVEFITNDPHASRRQPLYGEVVGFRGQLTMVSPYGNLTGIQQGHRIKLVRSKQTLAVGDELLGRVLNAQGRTIDGKPRPSLRDRTSLEGSAPNPLNRPRIDEILTTGVRAIDALLTCGKGQRLGIFAGSGVGKSTMMGMMTRYSSADVIVIGLVGERGREVNEFLQRDLGPEGLRRSVAVVATSDEPPLMRLQAASTATAVAEHFRDQGKNVLLMIDSVTRTALASREIGLAAGEPPTTRGYPPSTFSLLPKLVERAGRNDKGSITAFYSVLVEGDDPNEPIVDTMRGLLDGHLWLNRKIASRGTYPAIDIPQSISRLMTEIVDERHQQSALLIRQLLSALEENEDLISIGAYRPGANKILDAAVALRDDLNKLLRQSTNESLNFKESELAIKSLAEKAANLIALPSNATAPRMPGIAAQPSMPTNTPTIA